MEEIKSLVEREAMGEVIVSAGSAPTGPDKNTVAPDIMSCSSDLYSISVSPMRIKSPGSRRMVPLTRWPLRKVPLALPLSTSRT